MKTYLVGGAVRDQLLGLPVKERDYVVVGATVADMLKLGYQQVGKDFPVFLHPKTKEEYALARVERKVGLGYTGFTFDASPAVTLEEDLTRRDLTVNAIAQEIRGDELIGALIDPYHGQQDLIDKTLRHVSQAFVEDPVRILRIARFAARFAELGFTVAPETTALMQEMVKAGEVNALVAERVWKELERALAEKNPEKFFEVLDSCGAIEVLFPAFKGQSEASADLWEMLVNAATLTHDSRIRFAALLSNQSIQQIKDLCDRYRVPAEYRELAELVSRYLPLYKKALSLPANEILEILQSTDAFRRPERFENFLLACEACYFHSSKVEQPSSDLLRECFEKVKVVDARKYVEAGLSGKDIAESIAQERLKKITMVLSGLNPH
jgi:tRNA nucleotidyltransferase (CCA-adding enzyme)